MLDDEDAVGHPSVFDQAGKRSSSFNLDDDSGEEEEKKEVTVL